MSGLLRRIKRSRTADAGEAPAQAKAAAPDGAPTPADPPAGDATPATAERPVAVPPGTPVVARDVPAGLEPAEAPPQSPAGRRSRLRRRLRYLRGARELMLRDLGGLLYEIHRTGRGDVPAHATLIEAKVGRIAGLDAEAHALETALAAPHGETLVFQPGLGGTCAACGEAYAGGARFCASCGTSTSAVAMDPAAKPPPMPTPPAAEADAAAPAAEADAAAPAADADAAEEAPAERGEAATEVLPPAPDRPPGARNGRDPGAEPSGDPLASSPSSQERS